MARVVDGELWVVGHDIAVGRIGHENEFSLREGLEDLVEEEFTDGECRRRVAEVQGAGVEGSEGVGLVDEAGGLSVGHFLMSLAEATG